MDAFYVLAEVALGIAGFGSIAIVLGRRASGWAAGDYFRTSALFVASLGALLQALLVIGFDTAGLEPAEVWRASSAAVLAHYLIAGLFLVRLRARHLDRSMWFGPVAMTTLALGVVVMVVWLLANLFGAGVEPGPGAPFFAIVWLLVFSCLMLIRVVFLRRETET